LFVTGLVKNNISLVNGTAHLRRLWAIWRIAELLRLGRVPATAEDFALLDEILPADRDRTHSILLNLKTEVRYCYYRIDRGFVRFTCVSPPLSVPASDF
jgi:hypothetical protein